MAEALQPGTFRSIVAVEPILHSPMMMELMLSNPLDANPLSAGARRRRADFQSRYARHRRGRTVNGAHENKDGRGVRACRQGGGGNLFCLALPLQAVGPSCAGRLRGPFRSYKQSLRAWTGLRTHPSLPCRSHIRRTACASGPTPNWPPFLARAASRSSARRLPKRYGRAYHHTNATIRTPPYKRPFRGWLTALAARSSGLSSPPQNSYDGSFPNPIYDRLPTLHVPTLMVRGETSTT